MSRAGDAATPGDAALRERAERLVLERRAPRWGWRRIAAGLAPRPRGRMLAALAVLAMLPGLGIAAGVLTLAEGGLDDPDNVALAFLLFGPLSAAPAALLLGIGAIAAGRAGARALLLGAAALLLTLGGVGCGVGLVVGENPVEGGARTAAQGAALGYGPFVLLLGLPALAFGVAAPLQIRREFVQEQRRRILDVMLERGSVPTRELALAAGSDEAGLAPLLEAIGHDGQLALRVDAAHGRVYTARRLAGRQALLVETVERRGRVSIPELAGELREPEEVVRAWIAELRSADHLAAQTEGDLVRFVPSASHAEVLRSCDSCGGPMKAVGRGLFHCAYCDSEVVV